MTYLNKHKSSLAILVITILLAIIYYVFVIKQQKKYYDENHVKINGVYLIHPVALKDFSLTDTNGNPFNYETLKGHWTLFYFGFTTCEVICPTTMSMLKEFYLKIQNKIDKNNLPNIIFVSIDSERDSLIEIKRFVNSFNNNFIGLIGSDKEISSLEQQFHITSNKINPNKNEQNYSLNHTTDIILVNPNAEIQAYFTYPQKSVQLEHDYFSIIHKKNVKNDRAKLYPSN